MATFQEFARVAKMTVDDKTSRARLDEILKVLHEKRAYSDMTPQKAVEILEALGPTYIKLGQLMSDRSDLIPKEYCEAFATLRDDSSPLPFETVLSILSESFYPKPIDDVFSHIDPSPLGSASIAQVHKAVLTDGTPVAVKVRRPQIKETMEQDIELMKHLLAVAALISHKHVHEIQTATGFVNEISRTTEQETDLSHEMENLERFYPEARAVPGISSPKGYPSLSSKSVLVMEYITGHELAVIYKEQKQRNRQGKDQMSPTTPNTSEIENENESLADMPVTKISSDTDAASVAPIYDLDEIAKRIARSYISQFIDYGFFTSDPHMGNIIIRDNRYRDREKSDDIDAMRISNISEENIRPVARAAGEIEILGHDMSHSVELSAGRSSENEGSSDYDIVWIDMGMMGTLTATERQLVSQVFLAVARNDVFLLKKSMEALTTKAGPVDTGALLEMLSTVLSKYRTADLSDINVGDVLTEVLSVLHKQNLIVNPSITMLVRGIIVIEGVLSEISPSTSIIEIVSEHVMSAETQPDKMEMHARNLMGNLMGSTEAASKLPTQLSNTLEMLDMGELALTGKLDVSEKTLSTIYASISRLCLALLSVGLFLGSSILCTTNMQPKFLGAPLLGVIGFIGAAVLGIYLLVRIMQSRHAMANQEDPSE